MILIVDDSQTIAQNIAQYLKLHGFETKALFDGEAAFEEIIRSQDAGKPVKLVILDRMMPRLDGMGLLRLMRSRGIQTPVMFLTALGKPIDRLEWLELGAIEYIVKPIELREILIRVQNLLSFGEQSGSSPKWTELTESAEKREIGDITIFPESKTVQKNNILIPLSPKEYGILELLVRNAGKVVSPEEIFEEVWHDRGSRFSEYSSTITVHMAYLRKKLGKDCIRTVKYSGYTINNSPSRK
jgi:DNA-binding response OmpR family regulator